MSIRSEEEGNMIDNWIKNNPIPLETKLNVSNELAFINLLSELGYRDGYWTPEEDHILSKLTILARKHTKMIMEEIQSHEYTFEEYMQNVKSHLYCNASTYDRENHITYTYTNEEVDENIDYFKKCMDRHLSPYKALLFFSDHKKGDMF